MCIACRREERTNNVKVTITIFSHTRWCLPPQVRLRWAKENKSIDTVELPSRSAAQPLGIGVQQTTQLSVEFGRDAIPIVNSVYFLAHVAEDSILAAPPHKLRAGDVILAVNGAEMNSLELLATAIKSGEPLSLDVARMHTVPALDFTAKVDELSAEILAKVKHDVALKAQTVYVLLGRCVRVAVSVCHCTTTR